MSYDLSIAQSHAFALARTLMVPVTLFRSGDEFGVYLNSQAVSHRHLIDLKGSVRCRLCRESGSAKGR